MNQKSKRNSPLKYTKLEYPFSCSPSRISLNSSPMKKSTRSVYASPFASPRNHTNNNTAISNIIEEVKIHHQEIINEMDINHHNDYQTQNLRISGLVLETLWIHFLGKSFKLEDVVGDVASILDGVKELKSDWSMMIKHYEGLQRKVARRIYQQDTEGQIDQVELILDLQRIIKEKEESELKINELQKQIHSLQFLHSKQNKQPILQTLDGSKKSKKSSSLISPSKSIDISKRIQLLHRQVFDPSELISDYSLEQQNEQENSYLVQDTKQCEQPHTLPFMSKQSSKQQNTNISNMFFSHNSEEIQICQQSKKCIKQLIEIRQELGQELQSNKNLLQSSLQILGKAKKFIISYVMGNNKKKIFIRKDKENNKYQNKQGSKQKIDGIVQEIQKIQKMVSEKCKQKIISIQSITNSQKILSEGDDQGDEDRRLMEDQIIQNQNQNQPINQNQMSSSSISESIQYQKQKQIIQKVQDDSHDKVKTQRLSKQTRFILLEQDLCKSLDQLSKLKILNKIIKENLLKKQKQISELTELNERLTSQLTHYKGSFGEFRTPRNSFKPSQGLLAISQLIEEPQQNDITQKPQIQPKQLALAARRSNKLKSLFECFFPDQEDEKTTIKQIQNLRKQIQNYNQNQQLTTSQAQGEISPLQMVILSIQNFLEHLSTVEESQQHNILLSLRDQVTQITDQILQQSEISPSQYEQYIKVIMQKVYEQNDTPIRRVIEEFVYYLQGKNSEEILYLTQQFVRNIGKIEFGESYKSSLENSRGNSQVTSRVETPRNSQIIQSQ